MTVSSWENRIDIWQNYVNEMATKIEQKQYKKSKQAAKVYTEGNFLLIM